MNVARNVSWALGGLLVIVGLAFVGLQFVTPSMCGNEVLSEVFSPDRKLRIVVFQRDCGATTGFSTQASLLESDQRLDNEGGNVFVADTDHGAAPSGPGGGPELHVAWEGNDSVTLSHHSRARVFKSEPQKHGVALAYLSTGS